MAMFDAVWWFFATPLKNDGVKVSWDDDIPNISQLNGKIGRYPLVIRDKMGSTWITLKNVAWALDKMGYPLVMTNI